VQISKALIQEFADTVASYFVPIIIGLGLLILSQIMYFRYHSSMSMCFRSLYTDGCYVRTGIRTQNGILIKGGGPLEAGHKVTKVIFDKTDTLTKGQLDVTYYEIITNNLELTKETFFAIVGAVEYSSEHPLRRSIVNYGKKLLDIETYDVDVSILKLLLG
ncbi:11734_t:CDS:2, partial [Funneliformis caledonium]